MSNESSERRCARCQHPQDEHIEGERQCLADPMCACDQFDQSAFTPPEADAQREPELASCPFCGGKAVMGMFSVWCDNCQAGLPENVERGNEQLIQAWNTRSRPTVAEKECANADAITHKFVPPPFDCDVDREPLCRAIVKSSAEYVMNGGAEYRTCYEIEANTDVHKK